MDSAGGPFTLKLPAAPAEGDSVIFLDSVSQCQTNNVTIDRNGNNILGTADDFLFNLDNPRIEFNFKDSTYGWRPDIGGALDFIGPRATVTSIYADQMDNPVTSNWAVNALAPAAVDSSNSALIVRRFDDAAEEGVGFKLDLPNSTTTMTLEIRGRAETAPVGASQVRLKLYNRDIPDNTAVPAWSSGVTLNSIDIPTNTNFQYDSQIFSYTTLGLTAGRATTFELTRVGSDASDTLSGDWDLLSVRVTLG